MTRAALLLALGLLSSPAEATTYSYTGGLLTTQSSSCTIAVGQCTAELFFLDRVLIPPVTTELTSGRADAPFGNGYITLTDGIVTDWWFAIYYHNVHGLLAMYSSPEGDSVSASQVGANFYSATQYASGPAGTWSSDAVVASSVAVIANPVPGALPLFATGLAGLGLLVWRRRGTRRA